MKEVSGSPGGTAVEQSIALLESLAAAKAPVFDALPTLKHRLAALGGRDRNYLAHEYLTESWTPLWHSDLAREFHRADLDYVASATLGDNLTTEFLPPPLYQIVSQQPEALRQDVQDFVINQAFRRDIFCRGARRSTPTSPSKDKVRVHLAANLPAGRSLSFETSFGKIEWPPQVFQYLTDALSQGPMTLEDLFRLPSATAWKPRHILLLLLHANVINLEAAHPADVETSSRLNRVIARAVSTGAPYDHLAAARTGSAIRASNEDMLRFAAWLEDERAAETGSFVADTLPLWRRLGVVE
jgi:hypothetical protein